MVETKARLIKKNEIKQALQPAPKPATKPAKPNGSVVNPRKAFAALFGKTGDER